MGETFKRGQIWENEDGEQIQITDPRVDSQTEIYLTPVKLEIEPLDAAFNSDDETETTHIPRDTLLQEFNLVDEE